MAKYTRDTKFKNVLDDFKLKNACVEAIDFLDPLLVANVDITYGEALDTFVASNDSDQAWAVWTIFQYADEPDEAVQNTLISKITDPMTALKLYEKFPTLTTAQDAVLEAKFKDKLPIAEKELKDGKIIREKDKDKG